MKTKIQSFVITGKFGIKEFGWGFAIVDCETDAELITVKISAFDTPGIARAIAELICDEFNAGNMKL